MGCRLSPVGQQLAHSWALGRSEAARPSQGSWEKCRKPTGEWVACTLPVLMSPCSLVAPGLSVQMDPRRVPEVRVCYVCMLDVISVLSMPSEDLA